MSRLAHDRRAHVPLVLPATYASILTDALGCIVPSEVLGRESGTISLRSLRSVSEAIRRSSLDGSVETPVAESLLILGLEGSPHGGHTLWRLNVQVRSNTGSCTVGMARCWVGNRRLQRAYCRNVQRQSNRCTRVLWCGGTQEIGMGDVNGVHAALMRGSAESEAGSAQR
jgi:hypothetical protein